MAEINIEHVEQHGEESRVIPTINQLIGPRLTALIAKTPLYMAVGACADGRRFDPVARLVFPVLFVRLYVLVRHHDGIDDVVDGTSCHGRRLGLFAAPPARSSHARVATDSGAVLSPCRRAIFCRRKTVTRWVQSITGPTRTLWPTTRICRKKSLISIRLLGAFGRRSASRFGLVWLICLNNWSREEGRLALANSASQIKYVVGIRLGRGFAFADGRVGGLG